MRLSDEEAAALAARAEAAGMSRQRYLLTVALSEQGEGAIASRELLADLLRARRIVAGAADNMNQIARHANTVHEVPSSFGAAIDDLRQTLRKLDDAADAVAAMIRGERV